MNRTPLYSLHLESQAKMVDFTGYEMPLFYELGIVKEHLWVRNSCGIFDVSHMGQIIISGERVEELLSNITPTNFYDNALNKAKYTTLLNDKCTIIDDIIASKIDEGKYFIVVNAARKALDIKWLQKQITNYDCKLEILDSVSLIAVQGKSAVNVLQKIIAKNIADIPYMNIKSSKYRDEHIFISRTGYTGEDGFEISITDNLAPILWKELLEYEEVKPIGLGARDSLRLEMGYPLYGHELSEEINLGETTLKWIISSNENFIGKDNLISKPTKRRVGLKLLDKGIARDNMLIKNCDNEEIGVLTSAGYSPTIDSSIGQARIEIDYAKAGTIVFVEIRGKLKKAEITKTSIIVNNTKK
ncbi:MAG: glycine cleavage system aminomethyltransferase GcvT [Alphaproteobacteria bacterium]|jgi:aminomethyltransferase|nr:glycine cleavage system aminomethyltransferase GcvT [Alphaproteobacteria bacterium]